MAGDVWNKRKQGRNLQHGCTDFLNKMKPKTEQKTNDNFWNLKFSYQAIISTMSSCITNMVISKHQ